MNPAKPLISIITVTYNAENTLLPTLKSVNEQTWIDYEHLIIDGASKDATTQIAKSIGTTHTRIISEPDKGLYDAMNKGIYMANGKYLIFLNAGDSFHSPKTLETIAHTIITNNYPGIVYGQTQLVDSNRNRIGDRHLTAPKQLSFKSFSNGMLVCHQAFIASKAITSEYNLTYRFSADYDWCIRCIKKSPSNILIPDILIDYLNEGVTTANHRASLIERFHIMRHYYGTCHTIFNHLKFIPRFIANKLKQK